MARGRKVTTYDLRRDPPDPDELLRAVLGSTGRLRAPTLRVGRLLLVGFDEDVFAAALS